MATDLDETDDDGLLADLVARYEESLADATAPSNLSLMSIAADPALLRRWHSAKACLDLVYRVRDRSLHESEQQSVGQGQGSSETPSLFSGASMPQIVGRFAIERLLGAGGVGLVYLARDPRLGRHVALKVPRFEAFVNADLRTRFLREAEAAARLSHPNVVSVLETGQDDLLCYIAAEYCEGPSLAEWLRAQTGPVPVLTAAALVQKLSGAVQHAHSRGVLHRDIKPGNVMLVASPSEPDSQSTQSELTPKLTDFGMAKMQEALCDETRTGATIGTPAYMAPEQAAGRVRELDSRTDVYALGALLYELLSGQPPFRGETPVDTLRRVLDDDPVSLRQLRPDIPLDLEAICLKCLSKRPADRYQTAQQLTNDLDRFLTGEPVVARPPALSERFWKWARRRPLIVGGLAIAGVALLALMVVIIFYNARLSAEIVRADNEIVRADNEAEANRRLLYSANVRLAHESLLRHNVPQTLELLQACVPKPGQEDLREFSWHYVRACCDQQALTLVGHVGDVFSVAFSPDGAALTSAGKDHTVRVWDSKTGKALHVLQGHTSEVTCVAYSPNGEHIASGGEDHTVRIWNSRDGTLIRTLDAASDHILALTFSPDGTRLAAGGREPVVRVWNLSDWSLAAELATDGDTVRQLRFASAGARLMASDEDGRLHLWDTAEWTGLTPIAQEQKVEILLALAVARDSSLVAAAGRRETIEILSARDGELRPLTSIPDAHQGWIHSLAFNPASSVLASSGKDGVVRLWSPETWRVTGSFVGHTGCVWSVAWSPDGSRLASASADGQIRIWESDGGGGRQFPVENKDRAARALAYLEEGNLVVSYAIWGMVKYSGGENVVLPRPRWLPCVPIFKCELSSDRETFALLTYYGDIEAWRRDPLTRLWKTKVGDNFNRPVIDWSHDGRLLACLLNERTMGILDAATGRGLQQVEVDVTVWDAAFLPDDSLLISTGRELRRWDRANSTFLWTAAGAHHDVAVSPNGQYAATQGDARITVIDADTGHVLWRAVTEGESQALAISPDSRTLAAGIGHPGQIEFWDLRTGRELMSIPVPGTRPTKLVFSDDGKRLLAALLYPSEQGQIREWSTLIPDRAGESSR